MTRAIISIFIILSIFLLSGCGSKHYKYRISKDTKEKRISSKILKSMTIKEFYNFLKVKESKELNIAYAKNDSYRIVKRFCDLKGNDAIYASIGRSEVGRFKEYYKIINTPFYEDRKLTGGGLQACFIKSTNEFFKFYYIGSRNDGIGIVDQYSEYVISITNEGRKEFLDYIKKEKAKKEERRKEREERIRKQKEKIKYLQNRRGAHSFTFYFNYNSYNKKNNIYCESSCRASNEQTTGYKTYEDALNDNWKFVNKINDVSRNESTYFAPDCYCTGSRIILKK